MIAFAGLDLWGCIFAALTRPIRARLDRFLGGLSCTSSSTHAPRGSQTPSAGRCVGGVRWETLGGEAKRTCVHPLLETLPCYAPPVAPVHCAAMEKTSRTIAEPSQQVGVT